MNQVTSTDQRQPRVVKNKDILLLQEVPMLQVDIVSLEQRKNWERARMDNITQHLSAFSGGGGNRIGMDETLSDIEELEEKHRSLIKQYTRAIRRAERIINGIASHQMRTLVTLLYLDNVPDRAVQALLHMSRWTFENARKTVEEAPNMESVKWYDRYCADG